MNRPRTLLLSLICLCCLVPSGASDSQAQGIDASFNRELATSLQEIIIEEQTEKGFKGLSAAVILPGQGIWKGASGISGPAPADLLDPDMRFGIASIKKTFVASLVLQLVEEGVLTLDASLNTWLPDRPYIDSAITIRQLLTHTSGVFNITNHPSFWGALWSNPDRLWAPEEVVQSFVWTPMFSAGERLEYSNTNFLLLSMIVNVATGSSISSHYRERFWIPLDMSGSFLAEEEAVSGDIAHNWTDLDGDGRQEDISGRIRSSMFTMLWPFVFSTAEDLAKWAKALYGGRVLRPESLDEMLDFIPVNGSFWTGYGLGTMRVSMYSEELWGHTGLIPGYMSMMFYWPATGVSFSILANQDGKALTLVASRIMGEITSFLATHTADEKPDIFGTSELFSVYPNPASGNTGIVFDLAHSGYVTVQVYDLLGRRVTTLAAGQYGRGRNRLNWETMGTSSGVYLIHLQAGSGSSTRRVVLER